MHVCAKCQEPSLTPSKSSVGLVRIFKVSCSTPTLTKRNTPAILFQELAGSDLDYKSVYSHIPYYLSQTGLLICDLLG